MYVTNKSYPIFFLILAEFIGFGTKYRTTGITIGLLNLEACQQN